MPLLFVFTLNAPNGTWHTCVHLEPDGLYHPEELVVKRGPYEHPADHWLTVNAQIAPSEAEFRRLAACAATRSARRTTDSISALFHVLIPF